MWSCDTELLCLHEYYFEVCILVIFSFFFVIFVCGFHFRVVCVCFFLCIFFVVIFSFFLLSFSFFFSLFFVLVSLSFFVRTVFVTGGSVGTGRGGEGVVLFSVRLVGREDQPHAYGCHELQDFRRQGEQQVCRIKC